MQTRRRLAAARVHITSLRVLEFRRLTPDECSAGVTPPLQPSSLRPWSQRSHWQTPGWSDRRLQRRTIPRRLPCIQLAPCTCRWSATTFGGTAVQRPSCYLAYGADLVAHLARQRILLPLPRVAQTAPRTPASHPPHSACHRRRTRGAHPGCAEEPAFRHQYRRRSHLPLIHMACSTIRRLASRESEGIETRDTGSMIAGCHIDLCCTALLLV
ncbi:hypothetical protein EV641_106218 [Rhodococcus sp. SMB37]|nr:hypothetical protein EV641_106218 [Rhodococcus sp. SMB37]